MNYQQTIDWLFARLPMYQNLGKKAYKKDLTNITALCNQLNNPQNQFPSIHVAGTNGKGSVCHMLASVLQEAGYKVGLLTSPHLKDFRERIKINGNLCAKEFVVDFVSQHQNAIANQNASFFEASTAMAFDYFAQEKVDIAIVETGLGGELDSTNIIQPLLSIITNIGLDHTDLLGNTLAQIATAKAGIIKSKTPIIVGERNKETAAIFINKANKKTAPIFFATDLHIPIYESDLKGNYQQNNIKLAVAAIKVLQNWFSISDSDLEVGLLQVKQNTNLRGRWDKLQDNPQIIADTGHNKEAIEQLITQINQQTFQNLHLVLGFVKDKNAKELLRLFPQDACYYFSEPKVPRKLPVQDLKAMVPSQLKASFYPSVQEALQAAKKNANQHDFIFVGGSTFVVAEVI